MVYLISFSNVWYQYMEIQLFFLIYYESDQLAKIVSFRIL